MLILGVKTIEIFFSYLEIGKHYSRIYLSIYLSIYIYIGNVLLFE